MSTKLNLEKQMDKIEKLKEQKQQLDELIYQINQLEKKTIAEMIQFRKELLSLSVLQKNYPESKNIDDRIKQCDQGLKQCSDIMQEIKNQLSTYNNYKYQLNTFFQKPNQEVTQIHDLSSSARLT
jgi:uncharacterized phage infection (PIP) family protein YhgE